MNTTYKWILPILFILVATVELRAASASENASGYTGEYYDLLILGLDKREKEIRSRSDVIMIVHCEMDRISLFSIPRDTLIPINGKRDKINAAFTVGGVELAKKSIGQFLKFEVDNYIIMDFENFIGVVDSVKSLTNNGKAIGAEELLSSGPKLLGWLRDRDFPTGDRARCQRQQHFIKRVFELTQTMYKNQPILFSQCTKAGLKMVETDLTYEHVALLYKTYKDIDVENKLERFILPVTPKIYYDKDEVTGEKVLSSYYYYPNYDWPLTTYLGWFRKNDLQMNYKEEEAEINVESKSKGSR